MDGLKIYRNKLARIHVLAGALQYTKPASLDAAVDAANERKLARKIEPGETVLATNREPIPEGWYAMVEGDEDGLTIIACEPTFFESIWELDVPRN
jgi:hypothetical protein